MRTAIVVVVAVALGAILGALVARAQLLGELAGLSQERDGLQRENERTIKDYSYAVERLAWLESENDQLKAELAAAGHGDDAYNVSSRQTQNAADAASPSSEPDPASAAPATNNAAYVESPPLPEGVGHVEEDYIEPATEERRMDVQDLLLDNIDNSTDPGEQARLTGIYEQQRHLRDLFAGLREAQTPEDRQAYAQAIRDTRANLRDLVAGQQDDIIRKTLASNGIEDPGQQAELVRQLQEVYQSPFYNEPMFQWGMAPSDPEPETPGR